MLWSEIKFTKAEVIPIGSNLYRDKLQKTLSGITLKRGPFKTLGIWFSYNEAEMIDLNFNERIGNMKKNN